MRITVSTILLGTFLFACGGAAEPPPEPTPQGPAAVESQKKVETQAVMGTGGGAGSDDDGSHGKQPCPSCPIQGGGP